MGLCGGSKKDVEAAEPGHNPYSITLLELTRVNTEKDNEFYHKSGGTPGIAALLNTNLDTGLSDTPSGLESVADHRTAFGPNRYKEVPPKSFLSLVWEVLQDPILILLIFAALVSTVLGAAIPEQRKHQEWIEGVAIWVAVIIVTLVGAGNDWSKDRQFRKLNAQKDAIQVKVLRGGHQVLVPNTDVVVGDVLVLDTGDKVIADGILIMTMGLTIDEASLTGESDPIKKNIKDDPWVRSGTQVTDGSGRILVTAVGVNSEWGKTLELVGDAGDDQTPLQVKLEVLAGAIGKIGFGVAVCCFIAQLIKWCVDNNGFPIKKINKDGPIQFFLYSITIIVVAVPEGLPLAVTISLAYSMKKMMYDNNFVRVLAACETMGGATAICSDKTGTLTENRMTVVEGWFAGQQFDHAPRPDELSQEVMEHLIMNCAMNSKAFYIEEPNGKIAFVGNRTECALLLLVNKTWGLSYEGIRRQQEPNVLKLFGFSSAKKMASVVLRRGDGKLRVYNKGAAEWVLQRCTRCYTQGGVVPMTEAMRAELLETVTAMAKRGLRCLCLTMAEIPESDPSYTEDHFENSDNVDKDLTAVAIVGIKDPVRQEVPDAVETCKGAGITVRMVTGDNIHTAQHIARECGILYEPEHFAMEGPTFRDTPEDQLLPVIHNLRVLARSSPEDKLTLVRMLKNQGEVVAVTGDGTNDAPALKESDVGLAMGIAGTEVAKEAADIVILDDNFSSIVKSVMWGRCVFANIRKFLMFQLTVNFVALITAFIGAVVGGHEPLNVLQLLWVNLIMDTMGALALATEGPTTELLRQKPNGRKEHLINMRMLKHIFVQGCYQMFWMFLCLYALPAGVIKRYEVPGNNQEYYRRQCIDEHKDAWEGKVPYPANPTVQADFSCSVLTYCGYPYGTPAERASGECVLWSSYYGPPRNAPFPADMTTAVCTAVGATNVTSCPEATWTASLQKSLNDNFDDWETEEYKRPLSLLFNIFIMAQIANEVNARRINDEYNVFEGLFTNWIFMAVLVITFGLQAIIINFLGIFFKVEPLDWKEWLASIAIGSGAFPVSFLTRYITRNLACCQRFGTDAVKNTTDDDKANAGGAKGGEKNHTAVLVGSGGGGDPEVANGNGHAAASIAMVGSGLGLPRSPSNKVAAEERV